MAFDDEFDEILLGKAKGHPYFSFGTDPAVGSYLEGTVVEKRSRQKAKFQTKQQRDAGMPLEFEYWDGKLKITSQLAEAEMKQSKPSAKPIKELLLILQTALRDPANAEDDGLRTYAFPWRAQNELAKAVVAQGFQGGLPVGAFIRITLAGLVPVQGVKEPQREYKVELWAPGEQPSPSPHPVYQAPVQQVPVAPAGSVGVGSGTAAGMPQLGQLTPEIIQLMQAAGMAVPGTS